MPDINFLKDLGFGLGTLLLMFYGIREFIPIIRAALDKIPTSIENLTKSNAVLNATLLAVQQESKANAHAIGGLADTQSMTGRNMVIAIDKIATGLDTAMQRQQQYMELQKKLNETGTQTLAKVVVIDKELTGMEEMVGEILRNVLDVRDTVGEFAKRPAAITPEDLELLEGKLESAEKRLLDAITSNRQELVKAQPETTAVTTSEASNREVKEEVKP